MTEENTPDRTLPDGDPNDLDLLLERMVEHIVKEAEWEHYCFLRNDQRASWTGHRLEYNEDDDDEGKSDRDESDSCVEMEACNAAWRQLEWVERLQIAYLPAGGYFPARLLR